MPVLRRRSTCVQPVHGRNVDMGSGTRSLMRDCDDLGDLDALCWYLLGIDSDPLAVKTASARLAQVERELAGG